MNYAKELFQGNKNIAIIGLGYLGYSNLVQYLKSGIPCTVTDFNHERLDKFMKEDYPPKDRFLFWKSIAEIKKSGSTLLQIVESHEIINQANAVYFFCMPLEYNLSPSSAHLQQIIDILKKLKEVGFNYKPIIVIESFLKPFSINSIIVPELSKAGIDIEKDILLVYAPRRDWYLEEFIYHTPTRLVASTQTGMKDELAELFQLVDKTIFYSENTDSVEIAECLINSFSFLGNSLINQLMFAFPEQNFCEIVELAGLSGHGISPSIFCGSKLPISGQFLLDAAPRPSYLSLLSDSISSGYSVQQHIVEFIQRKGIRNVAILGLLPHENTPEYCDSPALLIPKLLVESGVSVKVHDPFFSREDIKKTIQCDYLEFPDDMDDREAVLLLTPHDRYKALTKKELCRHLRNCKLILDNTGVWEKFSLGQGSSLDYKVFGTPLSVFE